jgi:PPM family protein phosphatase
VDTMSLRLHATTVTDVGLVRSNNEDAAHAGRHVVALADGIGGMPAGELASSTVVRALAALDAQPSVSEPETALRDTVEAANKTIQELSESDSSRDGMGTTVTALMLCGDQIALINVGDSRCYLERDGELYRLTKDDTFVQALVDEGLLTPAEARNHPRRSIVTQALQGLPYEASSTTRPTRPGDRFLLCSDGLSDIVTDDAIGRALRTQPDLNKCAQSLIRLALDAGASDNVTVVVADVIAD